MWMWIENMHTLESSIIFKKKRFTLNIAVTNTVIAIVTRCSG